MGDFFEPQKDVKESPSTSPFSITVTEPNRSDKEFSVKVSTKTSLSQLKSSNFFCLRNYNDFLWLGEEMSSKHPDCIVPILPPKPEKKISDNADRVFCGALQLYLNKIGEHSVLQGDNDFQRFLEGEPIMFVKKSQGLAETGKGMLKDMMKKGAEGDSYFEDKRAFLHIHHSNAKASGKSIARIHKAGSGLIQASSDASSRFAALGDATTDDKLATGLKKMAKGLGDYSDHLSNQVSNTNDVLAELFAQGQRDLEASETALDNRLNMSHDYDKSLKNTKSKREAYEKIRSSAQSKPEKVTKAQSDVAEAEKQESDAKDMFFNTTENLKSEFARSDQARLVDFKSHLTEAIQHQIYYEKKILQLFQDLLPEIEAIGH